MARGRNTHAAVMPRRRQSAAGVYVPPRARIGRAMRTMWQRREGEHGERAGKHMQAFNDLLGDILVSCGLAPESICYEERVPMYGCPYKLTDVVACDPAHELLVNIELTSQHGSYSNNRGNLDAGWSGHIANMRKSAALSDRFQYRRVVLGRVFVLADEPATRQARPARAYTNALWPSDEAFQDQSFIEQYGVMLARHLGPSTYDHGAGVVTSRGYDAVWFVTSPPDSARFAHPRPELAVDAFARDLAQRVEELRSTHRDYQQIAAWRRAHPAPTA